MIGIDHYRACIGRFNNIFKSKSMTRDTSHFTFNQYIFAVSQYANIFCSVTIVFSSAVSPHKLAMMLFLLLVMSGSIHPNPGPSSDLSVCHINARSLYAFDHDLKSNRTKLDEIESVLCLQFQYDIICISETWLNSNISDEDVKISNYKVYRKDRSDDSGYGGVAIYVADHLLSERRVEIEVTGVEFVCIEVKNNGKSILVGTCYRPPSNLSHIRKTFIDDFKNVIENMKMRNSDFMMITGDFNDRCSSWFDNHTSSELGLNLFNLANVYNLSQLIYEPTRYTDNNAYILDLIFVDCDKYVKNYGVKPPLLNLDHCSVFCQ